VKAPEQGRILDSQCIYDGKIVRLEVDQLEFGGRATIREVVRHPGGVVLLGIRDDGLIPFVRQLRYPMQEEILELPAGKLDPGEDPREAAAREMEEETGYRPVNLKHVFSFYATPGFCDEILHLFYSPQLIKTARKPEFDEYLEVEFYTPDEALQLALSGKIRDAKTLTAVLWKAVQDRG
jgi:ADP-ribose pyrophosphatase